MISVEIEKEINRENKVVANFNMRQTLCVVAIVLFSLFCVFVLKIDYTISVYPCFVFGGLCLLIGWYKPNGVPFEAIVMKNLQAMFYGSNTRLYKTKNQYVTLLNDEYKRRQNIDLADKKVAKQVKKEAKKDERRIKKAKRKSQIKAI